MIQAIIVAVIAGVFDIAITLITFASSSSKVKAELTTHQAVQDTKFDNLCDRISEIVDELKDIKKDINRLPLIESKLEALEKRVDALEAMKK